MKKNNKNGVYKSCTNECTIYVQGTYTDDNILINNKL